MSLWSSRALRTQWRSIYVAGNWKTSNYAQMHYMAINAVIESVKYFYDLVWVGIINLAGAEKLQDGNVLDDCFHQIQKNLIAIDLTNCSKSAWVLPNYLAKIFHWSLQQTRKHSYVSRYAYSSPEINFAHNIHVNLIW